MCWFKETRTAIDPRTAIILKMPDYSLTNLHLTASIVLYHSDLKQFETVVLGLHHAFAELLASEQRAVIYVVDQSSDDAYAKLARDVCVLEQRDHRIDVEFIVRAVNGGYGAGHNEVLKRPLGVFHLVLNPDVELSPDSTRAGFMAFQTDPRIVALGPRAFNGDGREEYLAKDYPSVLVLFLRAFAPQWLCQLFAAQLLKYELRELPVSEAAQDVRLLSGCCMWFKTEHFAAVGGFDERYFMYFEDYDLSLRLAAGGRVVRASGMIIIHHGGNASKKGLQHILWFARGALRFFNRWGWKWL